MIAFYFLSDALLSFFLIITIILVSLQTIYVALISFCNFKVNFWHLFSEVLLLVYLAVLATMPGSIITNRIYAVLDISNYVVLVYGIATIMLISFFVLSIKKEKRCRLVILATFFTLPFISELHYNAYLVGYALFITLLYIRSIRAIIVNVYEYNNEITALSIKKGLDNLETGIMFYDTDGYIYLINQKMLMLMKLFYNKEFKNGNIFWQEITNSVKSKKTYKLDDDVVFRTQQNTWRFSKRSFSIDKKNYSELIVTDVTEIDKNLLALENNEKWLLVQKKEIRKLSKKMIKLKEEQEFLRLRSQIHDVMGQRLTALQRMLQTGNLASYNSITPLLQNIIENIKEEYTPSIQQSFFELKQYFERIGISIQETGEFPNNEKVAHLFLSIIREATTNATHHAHANCIMVQMSTSEAEWKMDITNDGKPPTEEIVEGMGLSGIRNRVENIGGILYIISKPSFCISVIIEKKMENSHD